MIAVVVAGLLLGHKAPILQTAQSRIAERINWRTIAFLLENTVFLLIGLQASWLFARRRRRATCRPGGSSSVCAATLVAVIVLRLVWVFVARYALVRPGAGPGHRSAAAVAVHVHPRLGRHARRGHARRGVRDPRRAPSHREILLLIAFTVVAGTLFIQGLSLPWLARRLEVPAARTRWTTRSPGPTLLQQASKAGFEELEKLEYDDPHGVVDLIRQRGDQRNFAAWERLGTTADQESPSELYARVRIAMIDAERRRVLEIRKSRARSRPR